MTRAEGRLHVRLRAAAERLVRAGHPWIFSQSIREQNREGATGDLAIVFDRQDRFLAIGFYDPASPIRVRVLHAGKPAAIDGEWWRRQLRATVQKRAGLFDEATTGWRILHGENDGWPALVLDRYGGTLVLKIYSGVWFPRLAQIIELFQEELGPERIVLRLSRNLPAHRDWRDAQILHGAALAGPVHFLETGICFEAGVLHGQKTGFFLDQRENRRFVESLARGRDVLNAFSFSGGFSLYAARGGARSVTDLDISEHALASSRRNFGLNDDPAIRACRQHAIQGDAFEWLQRQHQPAFDLLILDPPSLARREAERARAIHAYQLLNSSALRSLRPGGILVSSSCSAHVSTGEFHSAVLQAARASRRPFAELARTGHPADHPATFPEASYLKAIYLRFE